MDAILPEIHVTEVVIDAHPQITALLSKDNVCFGPTVVASVLFVQGGMSVCNTYNFLDPERGK